MIKLALVIAWDIAFLYGFIRLPTLVRRWYDE